MRLLVCGDRNWTDYVLIERVVRKLAPEVVIHGDARGADKLGGKAAEHLGIQVIAFPADWTKFGKSAGPIRNRQMLKEGRPDRVIAFHDSIRTSKGTKDMLNVARQSGLPTTLYTHAGEFENAGSNQKKSECRSCT